MLAGCCSVSILEYDSCAWRRELLSLTTNHVCFDDITILSSLFQAGFRGAVLILNYAVKSTAWARQV